MVQAGQHAPSQARAVLVYMMLGLSGHVDDVLPQYKVTFFLVFRCFCMEAENNVKDFLNLWPGFVEMFTL